MARGAALVGYRRGVTLIEAVLFISVALGLIVGGLVFFQQASLSARVQAQVRHVTSVVSEVRSLFRSGAFNNYTVVDGVLIAAAAVPPEIVAAAPARVYSMASNPSELSRLQTVWGTPMLVDYAHHLSSADQGFLRVSLFDIPKEACARLSVVDSGGGGIAVGTARVSWREPDPTGAYGPPPGGRGRAVDIGQRWIDATNPNLVPGVFEVTPSYASARCDEFDVNGRLVLVLNYLIDR